MTGVGLLLAVAALPACWVTGDEVTELREKLEDSGRTGFPRDSGDPEDDTDVSHVNAPEITYFSVSEGEPIEGEDGPQPTVMLEVDFEDRDGDLHVFAARVWADDDPDGAVDTQSGELAELADFVQNDDSGDPIMEGEAYTANLRLSIGVSGAALKFETMYDFGVIVYDSVGTPSLVSVETAMTAAAL